MSTKNERWAPDDTLYDLVDGAFKGVRRLQDAIAELGLHPHDRIVTSRDPEVAPLITMLRRRTMPAGFDQWQLPVVTGTKRPALTFITVGAANAAVPEHAHMNDPTVPNRPCRLDLLQGRRVNGR